MPDTRILVTGATGFVGLWTLRRLRDARPDAEVWATSERPDPGDLPAARYRQLDLRDETAVRGLVRDCRPTGVVHLASLIAGADLEAYLSVNVLGTGRLYDALAAEGPADLRIVQVGSAAMYGALKDDELPVREEQALRPVTPYAVSKVAQEYLATSAGLSQGLAIVRARIFNLLGPGQPPGLVPMTFIRQLADVRRGAAERLRVGLVTARRDFVDVRDAVRALDLLLSRGEVGLAYTVASGRDVSVQEIIDELLALTGIEAPVEVEASRLRPVDVPVVRADVSRIADAVGWEPEIGLRESLAAMWSETEDG